PWRGYGLRNVLENLANGAQRAVGPARLEVVLAANTAARLGVLLVEDEEEIVELMRDFLEAEGFEVRSAATGTDALRLLELAPADCVLLDVMLPGESGFEICRRLRSRSDVPIVFLTARAEGSA